MEMTRASAQVDFDQRVVLHGVTWSQFEQILAIRGERAAPRIAYLEGDLELMSPSRSHERIKKLIARLVEAYAEEQGLDLNGYGSWTVKRRAVKRGAEADECYVLGPQEPARPDLVIEVIWTPGGIDRLELWRALRVPEIWVFERNRIQVCRLGSDLRYRRAPRSVLLPGLDLDELSSYLDRRSQTEAVREFRAALQRRRSEG